MSFQVYQQRKSNFRSMYQLMKILFAKNLDYQNNHYRQSEEYRTMQLGSIRAYTPHCKDNFQQTLRLLRTTSKMGKSYNSTMLTMNKYQRGMFHS